MATNIEIEAKVLITKEDYDKLMALYEDKVTDEFDQTNYYVESKNLDLKKLGVGLRIRRKCRNYALTIKAPLSEGLLEKNTPITQEQYEAFKTKGIFPDCVIKEYILMLGFEPKDLKIVSSLKTHRVEIPLEEGKHTLSIDKNDYNKITDYELEMNSDSLNRAKTKLKEICEENGISYKDNPRSKQTRCLESL